MSDALSEGDLDRIAKWVATPEYERDPDILVPNEDEPQ